MGHSTHEDGRYPVNPPRRLTAALLLNAFPALARQFREVPARYYRHDGEEAIVACPCGRRPVIGRGELRSCEEARSWIPRVRSRCARTFIATNHKVLVTGGRQ